MQINLLDGAVEEALLGIQAKGLLEILRLNRHSKPLGMRMQKDMQGAGLS